MDLARYRRVTCAARRPGASLCCQRRLDIFLRVMLSVCEIFVARVHGRAGRQRFPGPRPRDTTFLASLSRSRAFRFLISVAVFCFGRPARGDRPRRPRDRYFGRRTGTADAASEAPPYWVAKTHHRTARLVGTSAHSMFARIASAMPRVRVCVLAAFVDPAGAVILQPNHPMMCSRVSYLRTD